MTIKTLFCEKCNKNTEIVLSEAGPHTKASCIECGSYIKFISKTELMGGKNMSNVEITIPIEGSQYNELIVINKYNEQYSLVLGGTSKDGNVFMKWGFPQGPDKQPREKGVPWKIPLGSAAEARNTIAKVAQAFGLKVVSATTVQTDGPYMGDDIPY